MHPVEDIRGTQSNTLHGKRILLCITGSIAAIDSVHIARDLIRNDADVIPVMTPAATRIIHPDALEFATGHTPITQLTGQVEHVQFCGLVPDPVHLILLPACTANTISKIAHGIDDTPVTTMITTALGTHTIPILLIPAMHASMYTNTIIQTNINTCQQAGIHILTPTMERTKARPPDRTTILATTIQLLTPPTLQHKKILIIGGATTEPIDDIRRLTNTSSGKMATALATTAYHHSATIHLWYGHTTTPPPPYITTTPYHTTNDLLTLTNKTKLSDYDAIIICAAIANYTPNIVKGKIPSGQPTLTITCHPTPHVLEALRKKAPNTPIIAFKATPTKTTLPRQAKKLMDTYHLQGVIGNTLASFGADTTQILILKPKGKPIWKTGTKPELATTILDHFTKIITNQ